MAITIALLHATRPERRRSRLAKLPPNLTVRDLWLQPLQPALARRGQSVLLEFDDFAPTPLETHFQFAFERADKTEIERLEADLMISRELGNRPAQSELLGLLALAHSARGDSARAVEVYLQRLELACECGDRAREASTLDHLSLAYADQGDLLRAQECHEGAQEICRELRERPAPGLSFPPAHLLVKARPSRFDRRLGSS